MLGRSQWWQDMLKKKEQTRLRQVVECLVEDPI